MKDQKVKKEYDTIKTSLKEGVNPTDIGKKTAAMATDKVVIKGEHGRYLVEISGNRVTVLSIAASGNDKNINTFQELMNKMYDVNLK